MAYMFIAFDGDLFYCVLTILWFELVGYPAIHCAYNGILLCNYWVVITVLSLIKVFWYFQDESQQFFREELADGAVYVVYLKKIQYSTSDDVSLL